MHIEYQFCWIDSFHKALKLSVVGMRGVWNLEVEWQILVIFVVPTSQDYENCGELSIALIYATEYICLAVLLTLTRELSNL